MLNKKLSYALAALLFILPLAAYVLFGDISEVSIHPAPWIFLGLAATAPPIITLAIGRMYTTPRLPKDVSWLWLGFFVSWAFVYSNIIVLASRQSTMQYGTVTTILDFFGLFDASFVYDEVIKLEMLAMQAAAIAAAILLFFVPAYAYWDKRRKNTASLEV